jgi:hypothetical protein
MSYQLANRKKFYILAVLLILFLTGIVLGIFMEYHFSIIPKSDKQKLNDAFQILYKTTIYSAGKSEISSIVNKTSYLGKDPIRLTLIADMITSNFTDPNWEYQRNEDHFCYYEKVDYYNYCCLLGQNDVKNLTEFYPENCTYMADKLGRIRQFIVGYSDGIVLNTDPYWIAYQKTGECQELSVLFNKTANESGFVTRIIRSDGVSHWWNEVNINGDWKFFDVQRYGELRGLGNSSKWFGMTSDYANSYPFQPCDLINKGSNPGIFVYNIGNNCNAETRNEAYVSRSICS